MDYDFGYRYDRFADEDDLCRFLNRGDIEVIQIIKDDSINYDTRYVLFLQIKKIKRKREK